ncbi:MAG: hypothetical protein IKY66_05940, partial [Bacteroidales bacterium]|nr:hypothetical protein [Bacteroidales bacterium]
GSEGYFNNLIYKHTRPDDYAFSNSDKIIHGQLFQLAGKAELKTIRFHKTGLPILKHLNPIGYQHYLDTYDNHHLRTTEDRIIRNHRIAEAAVMCMNAGIEARSYIAPKLTKQYHQVIPFNDPAFYISKHLKKTDPDGFNKTKYARIVGALFYQTGCYSVYNLRDTMMKWKPESELKVKLDMTDICTMNTENQEVQSTIFFCSSYQTGFRVLQEWKSNSDLRTLFTTVYKHVHFIPINEFGVQLLKILTVPHWNERLLRMFFRNEDRSFGMGDMPYDAEMNGTYILSFLDSDFARLYLFRNNIGKFPDRKWLVLCFQHQAMFLREYLGAGVRLKVIPMEKVMENLNIKRRELI